MSNGPMISMASVKTPAQSVPPYHTRRLVEGPLPKPGKAPAPLSMALEGLKNSVARVEAIEEKLPMIADKLLGRNEPTPTEEQAGEITEGDLVSQIQEITRRLNQAVESMDPTVEWLLSSYDT